MAQPPLSQAIRKLEGELGVKLLNRTSRVVTPTPAGIAFAREARSILRSLDRAISDARRAGGAGQVLRMGVVPFVPVSRVLRLIGAFRQSFPDWRLEITNSSSLEQLRAIDAGELELGIVHYFDEYEGIEFVPLFPDEPLAAYLSPGDPLAGKEVIRPDDVRGSTLIILARELHPRAHEWLRGVLHDNGFAFEDVHEIHGRDALRDVLVTVAAAGGIAVLPQSLQDVTRTDDAIVRRPLEPELTVRGALFALPARPSQQLQGPLGRLRGIAAELHAEAA
jgi:DNA-binding transcriptional LysR family regulator